MILLFASDMDYDNTRIGRNMYRIFNNMMIIRRLLVLLFCFFCSGSLFRFLTRKKISHHMPSLFTAYCCHSAAMSSVLCLCAFCCAYVCMHMNVVEIEWVGKRIFDSAFLLCCFLFIWLCVCFSSRRLFFSIFFVRLALIVQIKCAYTIEMK